MYQVTCCMCHQVHCLLSHSQGICSLWYRKFALQVGTGLGAATPADGSPQAGALVGTELECPMIPAQLCVQPPSLLILGQGEDVSSVDRLPASPCMCGVPRHSTAKGLLAQPVPCYSTCHKVSSVIAELHKGIVMLSQYCLPHESNYQSCHGGSEQKGVNFMGVIFA